MVKLTDTGIKTLESTVSKKVKVGNDNRQFILRIPVNISKNTILKDFKANYTAEFVIDTNKPNEIIVRLNKNVRT